MPLSSSSACRRIPEALGTSWERSLTECAASTQSEPSLYRQLTKLSALLTEQCVRCNEERTGSRLHRLCKCLLDSALVARLENMQLEAECASRRLDLFSFKLVAGLTSSAMLVAVGTISCVNCNRLGPSSMCIRVAPVTFAPGLARLPTRPRPTGSPPTQKTMGVTVVAALAATALLLAAAITLI